VSACSKDAAVVVGEVKQESKTLSSENETDKTAKRLIPDKYNWEYLELPNGRHMKLYPVPAQKNLPVSVYAYSIKDKDAGKAYTVFVEQLGYSWTAFLSESGKRYEQEDIMRVMGISLEDCLQRIRGKYKLKGKFSDVTQELWYSSPDSPN